MKLTGVFAFFILISTTHAFAADLTHIDTCLSPTEITDVINDFKVQMDPLIQALPLPLEFKYMDLNLPLGAFASFNDPKKVVINVAGHECKNLVHKDEFKLLLCHELGHIAGGAPYMTFIGNSGLNVAAEGQADFFATSSCLPIIFANEDNTLFLNEIKNDPGLEQACPPEIDANHRGLCMRMALAGLHFAKFVREQMIDEPTSTPPKSPGPLPDLTTHSKIVITKTLKREYPEPQCRLDTFVMGIHCPPLQAPANYSLDPLTPMACAASAQAVVRPACWFVD